MTTARKKSKSKWFVPYRGPRYVGVWFGCKGIMLAWHPREDSVVRYRIELVVFASEGRM